VGGRHGLPATSPESSITYLSVRAPRHPLDRSLRISFIYSIFLFFFLSFPAGLPPLFSSLELPTCSSKNVLYNTHTVLYEWTAGRHTRRLAPVLRAAFPLFLISTAGANSPPAYLWIMVDSRIQQAIADGKVPSDITAAYLSESRDRPSIIGIVFVTALTFLVVVTRLISRSFIVRRIGIDDILAVISLVSTDMLIWSVFLLPPLYLLASM
jgi:hypothetical protein